jgi:hypothetical protein
MSCLHLPPHTGPGPRLLAIPVCVRSTQRYFQVALSSRLMSRISQVMIGLLMVV